MAKDEVGRGAGMKESKSCRRVVQMANDADKKKGGETMMYRFAKCGECVHAEGVLCIHYHYVSNCWRVLMLQQP